LSTFSNFATHQPPTAVESTPVEADIASLCQYLRLVLAVRAVNLFLLLQFVLGVLADRSIESRLMIGPRARVENWNHRFLHCCIGLISIDHAFALFIDI
jgi:hypothetical protein